MITRLGKYIPFILIATALLVIIDGIFSLYELQSIKRDQQLIDHTREVITKTESALKYTFQSEGIEKAYIITGQNTLLNSFDAAKEKALQDASSTIMLTGDNTSQHNRAQIYYQAVQNRMAFLQQAMQARTDSGFDVAQSYVQSPESLNTVRKVLNQANAIRDAEVKLLSERSTAFTLEVSIAKITAVLSMLLSIFLLIITYFLIRRELQKRTQLDQQKNEFISMVSHELRTPITSLSLYMQLLMQKKRSLNKTTADLIHKMNIQIFNMRNLITDMLDITRMQLGKFDLHLTHFYISEVAEEVKEAMQLTTQRHKIQVAGSRNLLVHADHERVIQVLMNLVSNAIKYSPKGGKIVMSFKKQGRRALVQVKDQGIGISKENQLKIFNRYFRVESTETEYGGLGIGLYVCARIIQSHKGKIWVESNEGKGTSFFFTLPLGKK